MTTFEEIMREDIQDERQALRIWWVLEGRHQKNGLRVFVAWALSIRMKEQNHD